MTPANGIMANNFRLQLAKAHCGIVAKRLAHGNTLEEARAYASAFIRRWFEMEASC